MGGVGYEMFFGVKRYQDDEQEQHKPYNAYALFLILILLLLSENALSLLRFFNLDSFFIKSNNQHND